MSLKQLREAYNVPAYRGAEVIYTDCSGIEHIGHITSSNGSHINVKFDTGMRTDNSSGFRGVCWNKQANKWQASCRTNGVQKYLGLFDTKEEAHKAYCDYADKKFGVFFNQTESIAKNHN